MTNPVLADALHVRGLDVQPASDPPHQRRVLERMIGRAMNTAAVPQAIVRSLVNLDVLSTPINEKFGREAHAAPRSPGLTERGDRGDSNPPHGVALNPGKWARLAASSRLAAVVSTLCRSRSVSPGLKGARSFMTKPRASVSRPQDKSGTAASGTSDSASDRTNRSCPGCAREPAGP